jgi:hypothetical protein
MGSILQALHRVVFKNKSGERFLPAGLLINTTYFLKSLSSTTFTVHPTLADALAGTNTVDITSAGTGTHSIQPGSDYKNIKISYSEAEEIKVLAQDATSISDMAALFGNGDDGIRDGVVIIDETLSSYEAAYARASVEVTNRKNIIEQITAVTNWIDLAAYGLASPPRPGDTVRYSITLPTVNYTISDDFPLAEVRMQGNRNLSDFDIGLTAAFFRVGLLAVFRKMVESGELITLSGSGSSSIFKALSETLTLVEVATIRTELFNKWGSSFMAETFTVDTGTDVITTGATHAFLTEDRIMVESTTTLPGGLTAYTAYYVNKISGTTLKLYDSAANALSGGATGLIDITSAGTGTHTIKPYTKRWGLGSWQPL